MDLPAGLHVIHQPQRLRLMAVLYRHRDVRASVVRDLLGLTDGNLASHAGRLAEAGFLQARRILTREGFELRYRITASGSAHFREYLEWLQRFLAETAGTPEASGPQATAQAGLGHPGDDQA